MLCILCKPVGASFFMVADEVLAESSKIPEFLVEKVRNSSA